MIYLGNLEINDENIARVGLINYELFTKSSEQEKKEYEKRGVFVESLPERKFDDKKATLYIDLTSKEIWFEYEDIPPSQEEIFNMQINNIGKQLFETQTELLKSKEENEILGQQFFNLQTSLLEKGMM